jgi:glycosyltransferase involved in cell wall biosynthesis
MLVYEKELKEHLLHNMSKTPHISLCLPTYEMHGVGALFLRESFDILAKQTFKDFDVVISDNSVTDIIKVVCDEYKDKLDIKYFKHAGKKEMSPNVNNAIRCATGKILKILCQDDYLYHERALEDIAQNFDLSKDSWLVTACIHTKNTRSYFRPFYPKYNKKIHMGKNTISSPSVLSIKNENVQFFDENLKWFMDCDYYKRMHDKYGDPKIVHEINVVNRVGKHQTTHNDAVESLRKREFEYIVKKYNEKTTKNITLVAVSGIDPESAVRPLEISMRDMEYFDVVLISHRKPDNLNPQITFKQCKPDELQNKDPKNRDDYSRFMAYRLTNYIESDYALVVHHDAHVIRPERWDYEFLDYDYIGAPWPANVHFTPEGENVRVGNGGFSLRSKKLLDALNKLNLPLTDMGTGYYNEDGIMCVYYRKKLEENGIRFAPVPIAAKFSCEKMLEDSDPEPFGFHDNHAVVPSFFNTRYYLKKALKKLHLR